MYDLVVEGNLVTVSGLSNYQIGINDGLIDKLSKQGLTGEKTLNVNNSLVFPGFIDIHTHLREPGWEYKEDINSGTKAAIHGGVTSLVDMPNSPESAINLKNIQSEINSRFVKYGIIILTFNFLAAFKTEFTSSEDLSDITKIKFI